MTPCRPFEEIRGIEFEPGVHYTKYTCQINVVRDEQGALPHFQTAWLPRVESIAAPTEQERKMEREGSFMFEVDDQVLISALAHLEAKLALHPEIVALKKRLGDKAELHPRVLQACSGPELRVKLSWGLAHGRWISWVRSDTPGDVEQVDLKHFIAAKRVEAKLVFTIDHGFYLLDAHKGPDGVMRQGWGLMLEVSQLTYRLMPERFPRLLLQDAHEEEALEGAGVSAGQPGRADSPPPPAASHAPVPAIPTPAGKDTRSSMHAQSSTPPREPVAAAAQPTLTAPASAPAGASVLAEHRVVPSKHTCPNGDEQGSGKRRECEQAEHVHLGHSGERAPRDE